MRKLQVKSRELMAICTKPVKISVRKKFKNSNDLSRLNYYFE